MLDYASLSASRAATALLAASGPCKGAIAYAIYECGGYVPPPRYTPGFGPFSLAWGWCLLGALCGLLLGLNFEHVAQRIERLLHLWQRCLCCLSRAPAAPPGLRLMPPWHSAVSSELLAAGLGPWRTILQRLSDDGDAALDLLAAAGGVTRREALARVLGEPTVRAHAGAWGL